MASSTKQREIKSNEDKSDIEMKNFSIEPISSTPRSTPAPSQSQLLSPIYPSTTSQDDKGKSKEKEKEKKYPKIKTEIKEQKLKSVPIGVSVDTIITKSTLADRDSAKQAEKIRDEFNKEARQIGKSAFSTSVGVRGEYLQKDEFKLGSRNRTPELAMFIKDANTTMAVKVDGTEITEHGKFKHYDLFFGIHGSYVLNVPQDKLAKAMSGQKPLLFGPGPHVIKDPNFTFDLKKGFVNQGEPVIAHGNLNVIRVPRGSIAKIWIGTEPSILEHREEPYVFDSPLFRMDKNGESDFFSASDPVITHGTIHILSIPAGSYAKVWDGNEPRLLFSREERYLFDSARFRLEKNGVHPFFDASEPVIQHGTISIIRVPAGYIAKVWEGSTPRLLESRDEPYEFNSSLFSIEETNDRYFVSATESLIEHGSIKRILPPINHEAVVSDGGNLTMIKPQKGGQPTILNSSSQKFVGFLDKSVQTLDFPSKETVEKRKKEGRKHPEFEVYRTKDNLEIGVTLLVGYQVIDPLKAIEALNLSGIVSHIEHVADVDMSKAIAHSSLADSQISHHTNPQAITQTTQGPGSYGQQAMMLYYQDEVKLRLAEDLKEYGIKLTRLNIQSPKIFNDEIATEIEKQVITTAKANAQEAIIKTQTNIDVATAQREAAVEQVKQQQQNQALLSAAQAKLEAAKLEAEAKRIAAQAEADAILIKAKAEQDAAVLEGKVLAEHPALMELRLLQVKMRALEKVQFLPPSSMPTNQTANPYLLFNQLSQPDAIRGVSTAPTTISAPTLSGNGENS